MSTIELRQITSEVAKRGSRKGVETQQRMRARGEAVPTRPLTYLQRANDTIKPVEFGPEANEAMKLLGSLW